MKIENIIPHTHIYKYINHLRLYFTFVHMYLVIKIDTQIDRKNIT